MNRGYLNRSKERRLFLPEACRKDFAGVDKYHDEGGAGGDFADDEHR